MVVVVMMVRGAAAGGEVVVVVGEEREIVVARRHFAVRVSDDVKERETTLEGREGDPFAVLRGIVK